MAIIRISDLKLKAIIGTNAWERTTRQTVVINATFEYNSAKAEKSDDISDAVDYKSITKEIITFVRVSRFYLLEALCARVLKIIMKNKAIKKAAVRIDKPKALRFAKSVSLEHSAKR